MCLRCQMYFDSQPRTQKRCSTPIFIIRGWFPLFQVPICKILMYTNQSWFPFIFRKEQQREEFSATVQTGHESCRCGTARPSGDYVGLPRAKPRDGTMSRGDIAKVASEFHLIADAVLTETTQTKGERLIATGWINRSLSIKAEEHVVVSSQNTNQVRRWGSRDSVCAPVGVSMVSTVAC